jgi:hypothetical protein
MLQKILVRFICMTSIAIFGLCCLGLIAPFIMIVLRFFADKHWIFEKIFEKITWFAKIFISYPEIFAPGVNMRLIEVILVGIVSINIAVNTKNLKRLDEPAEMYNIAEMLINNIVKVLVKYIPYLIFLVCFIFIARFYQELLDDFR